MPIPELRDLIKSAIVTGARMGSLSYMQSGDFDRQARTMTFRKAKNKTYKLPLTDEAVSIIPLTELSSLFRQPDYSGNGAQRTRFRANVAVSATHRGCVVHPREHSLEPSRGIS